METNQETQQQPFTSNLLKGKKGLVFGVANKRSIAWGIAQALSNHGAQLGFGYQGERIKESVSKLVEGLPTQSPLYECDVTRDDQIQALFGQVEKDFGSLDFLVHCIAFASKDDLAGRTVDTTREGYRLSHDISAFSLIALTKAAEPLFEKAGGGSVVALTYLGADKVVPNYNVMGLAKASLESGVRYLAADLGKKNIRVNGISAGPISTLAARGISGFTTMLENHRNRAPLGRNVELSEIGNTAFFLLSPLGSGITGEIIYVDCGYRTIGA
ncbi:MAG: enoyl-ACP reductase [Candidatus Omnitrophica bacterium]|nr:enoyl-ACP reductase [Candidatus Omnitrophota bacterium]